MTRAMAAELGDRFDLDRALKIGLVPAVVDAEDPIATRNACETDWVNILSLHVQQEIQFGRSAFDVFLNIENFGNLINDDWGHIDSYTAPSNVSPATVAIVGNQYEYTPNASYNGTPQSVVPQPAIARLPSVYRVQLGVRFRF